MKYILVSILLSVSFTLHAGKRDSLIQRFRVQLSYAHIIPLNTFSSAKSTGYLMGQFKSVSSAFLATGVRITKNFYVGIQLTDASFKFDRDKVMSQLRQHYTLSDFYTTITPFDADYEIFAPALEFSYTGYLPFMEVEPYVAMGTGKGRMVGAYTVATIHQKQKNDNYHQDLYVVLGDTKPFFYPGIGLKLNRRIFPVLFATIGIQYNSGNMKYALTEHKKDLYGNTSQTSTNYTQQVSNLIIEGVLQMRFTKMRYRHK